MSREVAKQPSHRRPPRQSSALLCSVACAICPRPRSLVGPICHSSWGQAGPPRVHEQPGATARKMVRPLATAGPGCWVGTVMVPAPAHTWGRFLDIDTICPPAAGDLIHASCATSDVTFSRVARRWTRGIDVNQCDGARLGGQSGMLQPTLCQCRNSRNERCTTAS